MAKKEEEEKKKKIDEDEEKESTPVDVEIEGEEKSAKKEEKKEEKKADEDEAEVEIAEPQAETPEEKEQRLSKSQQRKQRQREAREAKEREISALRAQLAETQGRIQAIEQRGYSADVSSIDNGIYEAQRQMQEAKEIIKKAVEEKNGEALAQAQEALFDARSRAEKLAAYKQSMDQRAQQPRQTPPDPLLVRHAQDWMSKNRWYDPRGFDQDSQIALSIDQKLASDGWDPKTPEYWEEFSSRVAKYLPHRMTAQNKPSKDEEEDDEPSSQTRGSGRESGGGSVKTTFRVSKDRVDALKEAGQWEDFQKDQKFRQRMIRRFKEADEKHATK